MKSPLRSGKLLSLQYVKTGGGEKHSFGDSFSSFDKTFGKIWWKNEGRYFTYVCVCGNLFREVSVWLTITNIWTDLQWQTLNLTVPSKNKKSFEKSNIEKWWKRESYLWWLNFLVTFPRWTDSSNSYWYARPPNFRALEADRQKSIENWCYNLCILLEAAVDKSFSTTYPIQSSIEYFSTAASQSKKSIEVLQRPTELHMKRKQ